MRSTEPLLALVAHKPTAAVDRGFLPAAARLGLRVAILTDQPAEQRASLAAVGEALPEIRLIECDVFSPTAIIDALLQDGEPPAAIFSNSDHLQAATALAAAWFGLPGKDWRSAHRVKNKAAMRAAIRVAGLDHVWAETVTGLADLDRLAPPFPCVVKPRQGVASEDVALAADAAELRGLCDAIWHRSPGMPLLIEEFLQGTLHSLETLGNGRDTMVLGGYRCSLTRPPSFVIDEMHWSHEVPEPISIPLLDQLRTLGVGFGACHTEYVLGADGHPRLIEVNYRSIGDGADFLMAEAIGFDYFAAVLSLHLGNRLPKRSEPGRHAAIRYLFQDVAQDLPERWDLPGCRVMLARLAAQGIAGPLLSNRDYRARLSLLGDTPDAIAAALASLALFDHQETVA